MGKATRKRRSADEAAKRDRECREHREELLDEALEETFPASDPPSIAQPPGKDC